MSGFPAKGTSSVRSGPPFTLPGRPPFVPPEASTSDAVNRQMALHVLNKRRPAAANRTVTPSTNLYSQKMNYHSSSSKRMQQNTSGGVAAQQALTASQSQHGIMKGPFTRLPIDGKMKDGEIVWNAPRRVQQGEYYHASLPVTPGDISFHHYYKDGQYHPVRYPLGGVNGGLPWWHEHGHYRAPPGMNAPVPNNGAAERALAGRYHELMVAGRARKFNSPSLGQGPMIGEPHYGHQGLVGEPAYAYGGQPGGTDEALYSNGAYEEHHHHYYDGVNPADLPPHAHIHGIDVDALDGEQSGGEEYPSTYPEDYYRHEPQEEEFVPPEGPPMPDEYYAAQQQAEQEWREQDELPQRPATAPAIAPATAPAIAPAEAKAPWKPKKASPQKAPPPKLDLSKGCPRPLAQFRAALNFGSATDPSHQKGRDALWPQFDANDNGYVSLAECNGGIMRALCQMWGKEGNPLFMRYYRSYIRAYNDAKDASPPRPGYEEDDEYVTISEFRFLLVYLGLYAAWYEVFMMIDGATAKLENGRYKGDHRLSRDEWENALPMIRRAGATWADSIALREATAEDFDVIDRNHGGFIDLQEFCEWVEHAEKRANDGRGNAKGVELGVNEPVDAAGRFVFDSDRKWFTTPLEMRPGNASRKQMEAGQEYGHHRVRF